MCIEMTQSPMAVYLLQDGATVTVNGVPMIFTVLSPGEHVYFTTADSDIEAFHKRDAEEEAKLDKDDPHFDFIVKHMGDCYYGEYVKHVRNAENGSSGFTREEFFAMFTSGQFVVI